MATEEGLKKKLKAFMVGKSAKDVARELGISRVYLYEILRGTRRISNPAILRKFGYKKVMKLEKE